MEEINHKKGKIYYSMGEVSEMFDVNPSLIRFWESKFDILKPHKNKKGNRLFTPKDIDNLKLIYHLVKEKGMTLSGAQKRIKQNKDGIQRDMEVIDRLISIRAMLVEIREELKMGGSDFEEYDYEPPRLATIDNVSCLTEPEYDSASSETIEHEADLVTSINSEEHEASSSADTFETAEDSDNVDANLVESTTEGFSEGNNFNAIAENDPSTKEDKYFSNDLFQTDEGLDFPDPIEDITSENAEADFFSNAEDFDPTKPLLAHIEQPLFDIEEIEPQYIEELEEEAVTAAEVFETLAELEKQDEESPKPQIVEQTLF